MATNPQGSGHNGHQDDDVIYTYTVTVGHNQGECDICCMPAPVIYEFEDGSRACAICSGAGGDSLYRNAVLGGLFGGWADVV